jgi:hypothetical protein
MTHYGSNNKAGRGFGLFRRRFPALLPAVAVLAAVHLLFSCATLKPGDIPEPALRREPEPPKAALSHDIFLLRIDLTRDTMGGKEDNRMINKDGTFKPLDEFVPYNYLGVYLGNGFFMDLNGNLAIDIFKLIGLQENEYFSLQQVSAGSLDGALHYKKAGGEVVIIEARTSGKKIKAKIEETRVEIEASRFFAPLEISWSEREIWMHPVGLISELKNRIITKQGDLFLFGTGFRVEQMGPEEILLNNTHRITREGNEIRYSTGNRTLLTMVRSENRFVFFRSPDYGFYIEKLSDKVRIVRNGVETVYTFD